MGYIKIAMDLQIKFIARKHKVGENNDLQIKCLVIKHKVLENNVYDNTIPISATD